MVIRDTTGSKFCWLPPEKKNTGRSYLSINSESWRIKIFLDNLPTIFRIFESDSFCFSLSLTFLNEILVDDHWLIKKVVLSRLARDLKKHCALGNKMFQEVQKVCGDRVKTFIIVYKSMSEVKYINWPHQSWNRHTPDLPYCQNTELCIPLSNI